MDESLYCILEINIVCIATIPQLKTGNKTLWDAWGLRAGFGELVIIPGTTTYVTPMDQNRPSSLQVKSAPSDMSGFEACDQSRP